MATVGHIIPPTDNTYNQLMRGFVVANNDPKRIGRVKVRIYNIHGAKDTGLPDDMLPWAFPSFPYAAFDAGSYTIPEIGTSVWIIFEGGDKSKPVYIGGFFGVGSMATRELGNTEGNKRHQPSNQREVPKEQETLDVRVVYKSPKGSKIVIDERTGEEKIEIESSEEYFRQLRWVNFRRDSHKNCLSRI